MKPSKSKLASVHFPYNVHTVPFPLITTKQTSVTTHADIVINSVIPTTKHTMNDITTEII